MNTKKIASSFFYKAIERLGVKGLGLIISIVLARLLSPDDFGQIAIITVFTNISQTFVQSGLNTALVQSKDTTARDYSTVFYISLIIALVCILVLFLIAPFVGDFYSIHELTMQLRIYSVVLIFGAFNSVQVAKMQKEMRFKETMICSLVATSISGTIGIVLALKDCGVWSLIIYYMTNTIMTGVMMLVVGRWLPKLPFSMQRAKKLFSYGWRMLVSAILCSLYTDIRSLIIGKKFSPEDLGHYNRGQQFPEVIAQTIDSSIQSVMFPTLAEIQDEAEKLKYFLKIAVKIGMFVVVPAMIGLAALSEQIVCVLLTEKWLPCVVYMQLICIGNASMPIHSSNLVALKATGRSDVYMKLEIVRRISMTMILLISVFCFKTVLAIAIGLAISMWIDVVIIVFCTRKYLNYGFGEQIKDTVKTMIAAGLMGIIIYMITKLLPITVWSLALEIVIGVVLYFVISLVIKNDCLLFVVKLLKSCKLKKN